MTNPDIPLTSRPLFGGAISLPLPPNYLDASDIRQIPDNQEVFLSPTSTTSLVIEVLEMVEEGLAKDDLYRAAQFHFDSLAHDNTSLSSTLLTTPPTTLVPSLPIHASTSSTIPTPKPIIVKGIQRIHKYTHNTSGLPRPGHESDIPDEVWIGLALWRCWVIFPGGRMKKADLVCSVNVNLSEVGQGIEREGEVEQWWEKAVEGLKILDWDLFGDSV